MCIMFFRVFATLSVFDCPTATTPLNRLVITSSNMISGFSKINSSAHLSGNWDNRINEIDLEGQRQGCVLGKDKLGQFSISFYDVFNRFDCLFLAFSVVRMGVERGRDVGWCDSRRFLGLRTNVDVEGRNRWKDHQHRIHGWSFRKLLLKPYGNNCTKWKPLHVITLILGFANLQQPNLLYLRVIWDSINLIT